MRRADATDRQAGVTLLELLVVLAILALASMLVAPALRGAGGGAFGLRGVAGELAGLATSERARAMRTSTERILLVDLSRREYWAEGEPRRSIAARYALSVSVTPGEMLGPSTARIRFYSDGGSSGGVVTVADGGQKAMIAVDWLTGATRLSWSR